MALTTTEGGHSPVSPDWNPSLPYPILPILWFLDVFIAKNR